MSKILITAGPIPAKLDSVKYITNRFKGGLAIKTALRLHSLLHDVTIIKWKYSSLDSKIPDTIKKYAGNLSIIDVEDIMEYRKAVLGIKADVYVLAAAVANLMPSNPFKGKFPSHKYKVGDKIPIEFEIAPRIIDMVKEKYPRAGLVGYKLYDGTDKELIEAGRETLYGSKANIVFANHPKWAAERKLMLTPDGSVIPVTFDEHIGMIDTLARTHWYRTDLFVPKGYKLNDPYEKDLPRIQKAYPKYKVGSYIFGTYAYRMAGGFFTTSRGKQEGGHSFVTHVDHTKRLIRAVNKASLNAPLMDIIFRKYPGVNVIIHGHKQIPNWPGFDYQFPGTSEEADYGNYSCFNIKHHGYVAGFGSVDECLTWMKKNERRQ